MDDDFRTPQQRLVRPLLITVGVLVLGLFFWYAATHGSLEIENPEEGVTYLALATGSTEEPTEVKGSASLRSGTYTVYRRATGGLTTQNVTVPRFFKTVGVDFEVATAKQRRIDRVASGALQNVAFGPADQVTSYSSLRGATSMIQHGANDPSGLNISLLDPPMLTMTSLLANNRMYGFTSKTDAGYDQIPTVYDFATKQLAATTKEYFEIGTGNIATPSTSDSTTFGIYSKPIDFGDDHQHGQEGEKPVTFDLFVNNAYKRSFDNLGDVAAANNGYAVTTNDRYSAFGYGNDYAGLTPSHTEGHKEGEESEVTASEYSVKLFENANGTELRSIKLGKLSNVAKLSVSGDGAHLAVIGNDWVRIYDTTSGDAIANYSDPAITSPQWVANDRFLFGSTENGLFEINLNDKTASTLFTTDKTLNLSELNVVGNRVLFSAFSQRGNSNDFAADGSMGDAYVAYLDQNAINDNALIKAVPYADTRIKLTTLNGVIYASPRNAYEASGTGSRSGRSEPFKESPPTDALRRDVETYLTKTLKDPSKYQVKYGTGL